MWRQIITNAFWLTTGDMAGRILRIILILYAARILGAAEWGVLSYALSWAMLYTIATDLGIGAVITKKIARVLHRPTAYLPTAVIIKIALLAAALPLVIIIIPLVSNIALPRALIITLYFLIVFDGLRLVTSAINRGFEAMRREAIINFFTQAIILIAGIAIVQYAPTAAALGIAYALGSAAGTLFAFFLMPIPAKQILTGFQRSLVFPIINEAWPVALVGVLGAIMLNTDIVMLGWFATAADIGYYSAAQKIIMTLYVFPALVAGALFPALARVAHTDYTTAREIIRKSVTASLIAGIALAVAGWLIGSYLIQFLFGAAYQPSLIPFLILLITLPFNFPTTILSNALFAYEKQKVFIVYAVVGVGANALFNLLLIPRWGNIGAAWATVIAQIISWEIITWAAVKTVRETHNTKNK